MYVTRPIGADSWEEILALQVVCDLIKLLAISCEEDTASPWSVADTDHITLDIGGAVRAAGKRLVVSAVSRRSIGDRCLVET